MRHRKHGRKLDRHSQERKALWRTMSMSLFERFGTKHEFILTSIAKAKEVRAFAEPLITAAMKVRLELEAAAKLVGAASPEDLTKMRTEGKKTFVEALKAKPEDVRKKYAQHMGRALHLRRMMYAELGSCTTPTHRAFEFRDTPPRHERTMTMLIEKIAPRYIARASEKGARGGYTRVLKTAKWVKGDGSTKALWGFVGGENPTMMPSETTAAAAKTPVAAGR
jgi:ribosomal protein L17